MRWRCCLLLGGLLAALPAQEKLSVFGPSPATVKLGDQARVELRIEGRSAAPQPPTLPSVPGLQMELSPPSRSSTTLLENGRMTQTVAVAYILTLRPQREGSFVVPPFAIFTGSQQQRTPELRLEARRDLRGEELGWLDVRIEPQRVYVHEPLRVQVSFGVQQGLRLVQERYDRYLYYDVEVQAPWLSEFPGGERMDLPPPAGDLKLIVGNRQLFQAAHEVDHERAGQKWQTFHFDRAFLPVRTGRIELPAPMLRYHVVLREGQQDLFGRPRGQQTDNFYVTGKPLVIEVLPIPEAGRPTPFYGAVGRFALQAALDRDSVKVGNSVKLTLEVRGQGNCEFLRLPALDDLPGFHKLGQAEVKREAEKVVVTYDLVPLDVAVREVPAIDWNYFDTTPGVERFVSTSTKPLPLQVLPLAAGETLQPLADAPRRSVVPGVDDIHDLPDFLGPPAIRQPLPSWQPLLVALLPWLLALLSLVALRWWRWRAADQRGQRTRRALPQLRRRLAAGEDALASFAEYLGDRLDQPAAAMLSPDLAQRLQRSGLGEPLLGEVVAMIERGTAARYGGAAALAAAEVEQLAVRLERQRLSALQLPWLLPWLVVAATAGAAVPATAQTAAELDAAIAAYRQQDFSRAAELFRQRFDATGDRRHLQALGNCHYRRGELPQALWAYESARLGLPRDRELLANIELVRRQLQLEPPEPGMLQDLARLRDRLLPAERMWVLGACMSGAALVLCWRRRRAGHYWLLGLLVLLGVVVLLDLALWQPARNPQGIAAAELALRSEPRGDLPPLLTLQPGKEVELLGADLGNFVRVRVGQRSGYVERQQLLVVR